ncbi:MAG: hypothetical protein J0L93_04430 [Deltaproteobacteria bacterium]|nr:hypothetical protein [Deltaproteobacteria bacterium]
MRKFKTLFFILFLSISSAHANESKHLIIHAAEMGIGKFHRYDNSVHSYDENNIWINYVLPNNAPEKTPIIQENKDGSVTIFFSHLEELFQQIQKVSNDKGMKVDVLNINAHGLPGGMWFPKDEATMNSSACGSWAASAQGDDRANYNQYYSPISKSDINQIRFLSRAWYAPVGAPCVTGYKQWDEVAKRNAGIKQIFATDAQIHLFSCVVGLGWAGKTFIEKVAPTILSGEGSKMAAAMNFGLGDWSMPEGMGFWDFQNSEQLERDEHLYVTNKRDRDIMQKGEVRLAAINAGKWKSNILTNLDFMLGTKDDLQLPSDSAMNILQSDTHSLDIPLTAKERLSIKGNTVYIRIPGTTTKIPVRIK